jgi:hypothetical protein
LIVKKEFLKIVVYVEEVNERINHLILIKRLGFFAFRTGKLIKPCIVIGLEVLEFLRL